MSSESVSLFNSIVQRFRPYMSKEKSMEFRETLNTLSKNYNFIDSYDLKMVRSDNIIECGNILTDTSIFNVKIINNEPLLEEYKIKDIADIKRDYEEPYHITNIFTKSGNILQICGKEDNLNVYRDYIMKIINSQEL